MRRPMIVRHNNAIQPVGHDSHCGARRPILDPTEHGRPPIVRAVASCVYGTDEAKSPVECRESVQHTAARGGAERAGERCGCPIRIKRPNFSMVGTRSRCPTGLPLSGEDEPRLAEAQRSDARRQPRFLGFLSTYANHCANTINSTNPSTNTTRGSPTQALRLL